MKYSNVNDAYYEVVMDLINHGRLSGNRTGVATLKNFGNAFKFKLTNAFPLLALREINLRNIFEELQWMVRGQTNAKILQDKKVNIWNDWALTREHTDDQNLIGELGPVYGKQWRDFEGVDQLGEAIAKLKSNPESRRLLVCAWNPKLLPDEKDSPHQNVLNGKMALAPCHMLFQLATFELNIVEREAALSPDNSLKYKEFILTKPNVEERNNYLDFLGVPKYALRMSMYIRSNDIGVGAPYNFAAYAMLNHMIAHICNMVPYDLTYLMGDYHLYENQIAITGKVIKRPIDERNKPQLKIINTVNNIEDFEFTDFELVNYYPNARVVYPRPAV